eukprot:TRINITY_DN9056_c0_g1_i7.p1 TRINITY_DN9056_c0_g1~~TRINITY_DN9056_c0_g1_i7.p1  ORF type:complete len:211 (+),score=41.77 TRINITY_DN9056_c0_g1_i7:99-731(+)
MQQSRFFEEEIQRLRKSNFDKDRELYELRRSCLIEDNRGAKVANPKSSRSLRLSGLRREVRKWRSRCLHSSRITSKPIAVDVDMNRKKEEELSCLKKQLESIVTIVQQNDQHLIAQDQHIEALCKKVQLLSKLKDENLELFQRFKDSIQGILEKYSQKLHDYNKKEISYRKIVNENKALRSNMEVLLQAIQKYDERATLTFKHDLILNDL